MAGGERLPEQRAERAPKPLHAAVHDLSAAVARALQAVLPPGFRGHLEIAVDGGVVQPYDVSVKFRPPQPKAGAGQR